MESDRGGDVEEVNAEIASDKKSDENHGLDFSSGDVTRPTISKGEPGQETPKPEPALPAKTGGKQTIKKSRTLAGNRVREMLAFNGNGKSDTDG